MNVIEKVKGLARKIRGSILKEERIRREAKQYGKAGASLREEIRRCSEADYSAMKAAILGKFTAFSNRKRDAWLSENGVDVKKHVSIACRQFPGITYRQAQQRAMSAWVDGVRDGVL